MQTEDYGARMQTMTRDPGTAEFLNRLDERFDQVDRRFDRVEASIVDLRTEMREQNAELRTEIGAVRSSSDAMQQTIMWIGAGLIGTLFAACAALIATQI
jgi:hypothetical protein